MGKLNVVVVNTKNKALPYFFNYVIFIVGESVKKGFILIELLAVIVILSIIA